jgi:hypothetical protein
MRIFALMKCHFLWIKQVKKNLNRFIFDMKSHLFLHLNDKT